MAGSSKGSGSGTGTLTVGGNGSGFDDLPVQKGPRHNPPASAVVGQHSAIINVHGCTMRQVAIAVETNDHPHDVHPGDANKFLHRHPIYLVAIDADGEEGEPAEGTLEDMREKFSAAYDYVSPDAPPADGSHRMVL